jgi:hypothetical protein
LATGAAPPGGYHEQDGAGGRHWVHTATHHLLDRLMDVERAELQRMQNSAVVDNLVVRRRQRGLGLLRLRDRI